MAAEKFNFNKGLLKLEDIINKMESGDLSLEIGRAHV